MCGTPQPGEATCFGLRRTDVTPRKGLRSTENPEGFGPTDLRSAYGLPAKGGAGQTIAIVDAFDNPNAEADLAVYRAQYGLPACTTADGCFTKVNQRGGTDYPDTDAGWATEISLDLDMVSAVAPNARILLVESDGAGTEDLAAAVDQAVALGARYVSNSWGSNYPSFPENPAETAGDVHFDHPGVAIVASSGDYRYGVSYPAASPHVTAIGGTSLTKDSGSARGWSESVWSHGSLGTGSGCSLYEPKPVFQKDTGCVGRTVADVSAVADPSTGVAVYDTFGESGGWGVAGGTSASAPIVAGVYANAGTPVAGTYPNAYPYAGRGTGLHDVTTGANGKCSPAYLCTGGPGYDGPTGLGTPSGLNAFRMGPHGTLSGTVTDRSTGRPLAAAEVSAGVHTTTTDGKGRYTLPLPAGEQRVEVTAYGYASGREGVHVTQGRTATQGFSLHRLATHRISGTVTDNSGHGWPLHARIAVDGVPGAPIWSDPLTGAYRLDLPGKHTYTLRVTADGTDYRPLVRQVKLSAQDRSLPLPMTADSWAEDNQAYTLGVKTLDTQSFDSTADAPRGWSVVDAPDSVPGWTFDDPGGRGNNTGGAGGFAVADNDHAGPTMTMDSQLVSPVYDFRNVGEPAVEFGTEYAAGGADQSGDVDITTDGGRTWTTVWHQGRLSGSGRVRIPLPDLAGRSAVKVRFHFTGPGVFWSIDDIAVTGRTLTPVPGGILTGTVRDATTGRGLIGVQVGKGSGPYAMTTATAGDPRVGDGLYRLFVPGGGRHDFTAAKPPYQSARLTATVPGDRAVKGSFSLTSGRLSADTSRIEATAGPQDVVTSKVTVRNSGTAPATLTIGERTGTGPGGSAPGTDWKRLPDLPAPVMDNAVESHNGTLYSALGSTDGLGPVADLWIYSPSEHAWTRGADAPEPRQATAHGIIGDRLYTVGGFAPGEKVSNTVQVYDTATRTWAKGPDVPEGVFGAGSAVIDGRLYVVGGCTNERCGDTVQVLDPDSGTWSKAERYPVTTGWAACGAIEGKLYCAGGVHENKETTAGFVYDPASNHWEPIADMPVGLASGIHAAANGRLLMSGGAKTVGFQKVATTEGYAYDPGTDAWSTLPDAPRAVVRGGGAPGLYQVGGNGQIRFPTPVATVNQLPGYDHVETDVPWLSESTHRLVLRPGQSASFTVSMDARVVDRSGDWTASLILMGDTPYRVAPVPVSLHRTNGRTS
ncbi:carboxypeptidase regulatory-like domain-containing protein [Streptomyces griseoluteus]|uniref:Kelch repeat-containing protein n=1 Tax=Streptomyces griseoluteus TaxID=29306 RepID=UPI0037F8C92A